MGRGILFNLTRQQGRAWTLKGEGWVEMHGVHQWECNSDGVTSEADKTTALGILIASEPDC